MLREIVTYPIERTQLHEELDFMVQYFLKKGVTTCTVLFGFSWGNEYYPSNKWFDEEILLGQLVEKVRAVELSGIGALGKDDLFVKVSDLEFQFCNDSDIHIRLTESNSDSESFYLRWKQLGYQPAEWVKNKQNEPADKNFYFPGRYLPPLCFSMGYPDISKSQQARELDPERTAGPLVRIECLCKKLERWTARPEDTLWKACCRPSGL